MNHTISGRDFQNLWFNGTLVGETGINAALCGTWGCPVLLVTGDEASCREGTELLGDGLTTVAVKRGFGSFGARNLAPARARELIEAGAKQALVRPLGGAPYDPGRPVRDQGRVQEHERRPRAPLPAGVELLDAAHDRLPRRHLVGGLEAVLLLSAPGRGHRTTWLAILDYGTFEVAEDAAGSRFSATSIVSGAHVVLVDTGFPGAYYEDADAAGRADGLDELRPRRVDRIPRTGRRRSSRSLGLDSRGRHRARDHARRRRPRRRASTTSRRATIVRLATGARSRPAPLLRRRAADGLARPAPRTGWSPATRSSPRRDAARDARALARPPLAPGAPARERGGRARLRRDLARGGARERRSTAVPPTASAARSSAERLLALARTRRRAARLRPRSRPVGRSAAADVRQHVYR